MDRERDNFLELLLRHQTEIKAFIGSVLRERHDRDDVFQEVAMILWRQFGEFDPSKSFGAWARGIAANKVLHAIRERKRTPAAWEPQAIEAVLGAFERIASQTTDRKDALAQCLEQLPTHSRELLTLKYEQNLRADEIGKQLKQKPDAIYQSLSRLRASLAECVQRRLAVAGG